MKRFLGVLLAGILVLGGLVGCARADITATVVEPDFRGSGNFTSPVFQPPVAELWSIDVVLTHQEGHGRVTFGLEVFRKGDTIPFYVQGWFVDEDEPRSTEFAIGKSLATDEYYLKLSGDNLGSWRIYISKSAFAPAPVPVPSPGTFADENLEAVIRDALGKPAGEEITAELAELTKLDADSSGIADLRGLEYCSSLTHLTLGMNWISDISPLSSLSNLTDLTLDANEISDISPLASLTNLSHLDLYGNQIVDISPLASLTNLTYLDLDYNHISDISPLVENSGLSKGDEVRLEGNPLSNTSVNVYIPQLYERGVVVHHPAVPSPVTLISPEEGAVLDNGRTDGQDSIVWRFEWSPVEGASLYHLRVGAVIDEYVVSTSHDYVSDGSYIDDTLRHGWTWKVRAKVGDQWSAWAERTFDVEPVNSDPPAPATTPAPAPAPSIPRLLVDASKGGGVWWFPQSAPFNPEQDHQGKALADYLGTLGYEVTELPRPYTITEDLLEQYDVVIRASGYTHSTEEIDAYKAYVRNGGKLLLLSDYIRPGETDSLAAAFGLIFAGTARGPEERTISQFSDHPITKGVSSIPYMVGSGLIDHPPEAQIVGWLSQNAYLDLNDNQVKDPDEPTGPAVLGYMNYGDGKIVFIGDTNALEQVPLPVTKNIIYWLEQ